MEKLWISLKFHTVYPCFAIDFAMTDGKIVVEFQNRTKVENLSRALFFLDFFRLFHKSFPLTGKSQKSKNNKNASQPRQSGKTPAFVCFLRIFVNVFPTSKPLLKHHKINHIYRLLCLSTVSAGTTNITIIIYIILSLYIARSAQTEREGTKKGKFL